MKLKWGEWMEMVFNGALIIFAALYAINYYGSALAAVLSAMFL